MNALRIIPIQNCFSPPSAWMSRRMNNAAHLSLDGSATAYLPPACFHEMIPIQVSCFLVSPASSTATCPPTIPARTSPCAANAPVIFIPGPHHKCHLSLTLDSGSSSMLLPSPLLSSLSFPSPSP
eukprot:752894-Hanusia_phi.AAC.1